MVNAIFKTHCREPLSIKHITVAINGRQNTKENLSRIFDNHFTTNKKGLGLGLPFCKRMMEAMGGKIECESEEGSYTKFLLLLKLSEKT